jgi:hypothetical protein
MPRYQGCNDGNKLPGRLEWQEGKGSASLAVEPYGAKGVLMVFLVPLITG